MIECSDRNKHDGTQQECEANTDCETDSVRLSAGQLHGALEESEKKNNYAWDKRQQILCPHAAQQVTLPLEFPAMEIEISIQARFLGQRPRGTPVV